MKILGLSCFYHDSASCILVDGNIVAAAQEERFSRVKHDRQFPKQSIVFCLKQAGLTIEDIDKIIFYDKPLLKFERVLETYLAEAPLGFKNFIKYMPTWLKEKLYLRKTLKNELTPLLSSRNQKVPPLHFSFHHHSHACSAFFPSPFEEAAVLCVDGVGEWATTSGWQASGNRVRPLWQIDFPHSLGLLYSAFTAYLGFKVNSGEYKLMGLAPYGEPHYVDLIKAHLIDIKEDGSFRLNMKYFDYTHSGRMTSRHFHKLFGGEPRALGAVPGIREMNIARSIQAVLEEVIVLLAKSIHKQTQSKNLCLAGGVALNCVANGKILEAKIFENIWVAPASGDAGGALGAALAYHYQFLKNKRSLHRPDQMSGGYLGPSFGEEQIEELVKKFPVVYKKIDELSLLDQVSGHLVDGLVVGWFQGRMEYGPRALGARSILADARCAEMQKKLNLKIKYRESFRPFAPIVLEEDRSDYFERGTKSPYMLFTDQVRAGLRIPLIDTNKAKVGLEKLRVKRSTIPAVTHVDHSARLQTVSAQTNPKLHRLLEAFKKKTGCSVLINTSFNVRGEPIVCTPRDALNCFVNTEMDVLVIENYIFLKTEQPSGLQRLLQRESYELD